MLPDWPAGTVVILATAGEAPHAIPVSAAVRAGPQRVLIGLARGRTSLARLRVDPAVALTVVAEGVAVTVHGRARVVAEELTGGVVAVAIDVAEVQDHDRPTFEIQGGVAWRWTDGEAEARDREVRAGLERLISEGDL